MLDEILPNFRGKEILLFIVGIGFLLIFIAYIYFGMGYENYGNNCPSFRGFPTCD